jgi:hypothetical protein
MCLLGRTFGEGAGGALIAFQPMFTSSSIEILVMTADTRSGTQSGEVVVTHYPGGTQETGSYVSNGSQKKRVTRITISRSVWDRLDQTEVIGIKTSWLNIRARLARFQTARAAFDECERSFLKEWGVDPASLDPERRPVPTKNPARWFTASSYPVPAVRGGQAGRVVVVLNVDDTGRVSNCRVVATSWPQLNEATCGQSRNITFKPGVDKDGRATPSIYLLPVRWLM